MEDSKNILGKKIKQLRKEFELTQEELALKLGLKGKSSIANYEAGNITPSDDIKLKMCEIFDCTLDYLMGKSDVRKPEKINIDDVDVAFSSGYKGLNDTNKMIIKNTLEALLAKQEKDEENKK